jgi:Tfp pilus assembly protein PilW
MKKSAGFNLVELMVALAMSAAIIAVITSSFASLNGSFMYSNNLLELHQKLRLSLRIIEQNVQNAGTFGNFSFHHQLASSAYESAATGDNCTDDWCKFDNTSGSGMGVGVRSYTALPANVAAGATLVNGSNVLRVQYGSSIIAPLNFMATPYVIGTTSNCFAQLNFSVPTGFKNASVYMLSSADRAYSLNFSTVKAPNSIVSNGVSCPTSPLISFESYAVGGTANNSPESSPDVYSMALVNFNTSYYFVATINNIAGLYVVKMSADKILASPKLISGYVTNMTISYLVLKSSGSEEFNNYDSTAVNSMRYTWCSTEAMNSTGECQNKWHRIVAINIALTGQNTTGSNVASQTESQTVGWLW